MFRAIDLAQNGSNSLLSTVQLIEIALRNLFFPLLVLVVGYLMKSIAEFRNERLRQVRIVDAMLEEIKSARESWRENKLVFEKAHSGGDASTFARRIDEDANYYPYIVNGKSASSVVASADSPAVEFSFIRSEYMKDIIKFHDSVSLLSDQLADLREKQFQQLGKPRKLAALEKIVEQYGTADARYAACEEALNKQKSSLTTRSLTWAVFFPFRAKTYLFYIVIIWIAANLFFIQKP